VRPDAPRVTSTNNPSPSANLGALDPARPDSRSGPRRPTDHTLDPARSFIEGVLPRAPESGIIPKVPKDRREHVRVWLGTHGESSAHSPHGVTYRVALDRRGIIVGNGRLGWLTIPIGWVLHRLRWRDQWLVTAARPLRGRELLQWRVTTRWQFGPFNEAQARAEFQNLHSLIESGAWFEGTVR